MFVVKIMEYTMSYVKLIISIDIHPYGFLRDTLTHTIFNVSIINCSELHTGSESHCELALSRMISTLIARFMGTTWAHLGPTWPRWAPCWPHEPCYLGSVNLRVPWWLDWADEVPYRILNWGQITIKMYHDNIQENVICKIVSFCLALIWTMEPCDVQSLTGKMQGEVIPSSNRQSYQKNTIVTLFNYQQKPCKCGIWNCCVFLRSRF